MIGQKSFEINADDFLRGISSSDFITDGGLSNKTAGINLTKTPGLLYYAAAKVDTTDELEGDMISSCEDGTLGTAAVDRVVVDNEGKYYTWNGTLLDKVATDSTTTSYTKGYTNMISFGITSARANVFTTNPRYITRLQLASNTLTENFKEFTFNGTAADLVAPHPCIVFENNAYYGDGNLLRRQTSATDTTVAVIMTLPSEQIITGFGIDPGSGRLLISVVDGVNASDTKARICRVLYHDGFSNKALKSIIVDDMITAFYPVGAILFIGYGTKLGVWNGAGIQFLRDLDISLTSTKLPYRDNFTNIDDTLYVIEGHKILAYGEVVAGFPKCFYYAHINKNGSLVNCDLTAIFNAGSGLLAFGWIDDDASEEFSTLDTTSVSTLGNTFSDVWTNKYVFARPVTFNNLVIEYGAALPTSNSYADIYLYDDTQTATQIATGATNTVANTYTVEYPWPSITTRSLQFRYLNTQLSGQTPIRRMTVFYTPVD